MKTSKFIIVITVLLAWLFRIHDNYQGDGDIVARFGKAYTNLSTFDSTDDEEHGMVTRSKTRRLKENRESAEST